MLDLGPLVFATPWMLAALATLPVLWWLLRVMPPAPLVRAFPPLSFLLALRPQEETPARTPLWLIILRVLIATLIIVGLAHPLWNPGERLGGSGPLVLVIDDGWAAAPHWDRRVKAMNALVDQADRDGRAVRFVTTSRSHPSEPLQVSELLRAGEARQRLRSIKPKPWQTDRNAVFDAATALGSEPSAHIAWLSDGLDSPQAGPLMRRLLTYGNLRLYRDSGDGVAHLITTPRATADGIAVPVQRADSRGTAQVSVRLIDQDGRMLGRETARFEEGKNEAEARFPLPVDIRNRVARAEIEGENGAGSIFLLDDRWRRRPVGIASASVGDGSQPLLSDDYYLVRALEPFSDIQSGQINDLLKQKMAVIVLADIGKVSSAEVDALSGWIDKGGVLLRFAGPHLAQGTDTLVPVQLRGGGRALGGTMSWTTPARLLPFDDKGPFAGLKIPGDVRIERQVLAEPTIDLNDKTWARLSDGTPLVTAERRGAGWIVLIHTTANTEWSNLPISGLFLEMLQRIVALSQGIAGDDGQATYPPLETMDGFGVLGSPPATAVPITGKDFAQARAKPETPPGYYGRGEARRSLNVAAGMEKISLFMDIPAGVESTGYDLRTGFDAKPWLLLMALILLLADLIISFALRGLTPGGRRVRQAGAATAASLAVAVIVLAASGAAVAQSQQVPANAEDAFALRATLETRLAYVVTGDNRLDAVSRAGLTGLSEQLRRRTAVEPGEPMAVDIERDEMAFFPLLYWPVSLGQRPPSDRAVEKLNAYLRGGGTILFDTREESTLTFDPFGTGGATTAKLRQMLGDLDIPALIPVPIDHVLTKSFYLLKDFPGRWTGGTVWVERRGGRHNDGVSSIIIGGNDWAGAWAVNEHGTALFPVAPGGERQREFAYRFGINWVMYALTGNYKTDQVHVPAIIERLGQ